MKTYILSIIGLALSLTSNAQRFEFKDLIHIYHLAEDNTSLTAVDHAIKEGKSDWTGPKPSKKGPQNTFYWVYNFDESIRGTMSILKDDNPAFPVRLIFQFPYLVQYNEYLSNVASGTTLVNVFTENGKQTRVYEDEHLVIAMSIFLPETKKYFNEGRAAPFYEIYFQRKGLR